MNYPLFQAIRPLADLGWFWGPIVKLPLCDMPLPVNWSSPVALYY